MGKIATLNAPSVETITDLAFRDKKRSDEIPQLPIEDRFASLVLLSEDVGGLSTVHLTEAELNSDETYEIIVRNVCPYVVNENLIEDTAKQCRALTLNTIKRYGESEPPVHISWWAVSCAADWFMGENLDRNKGRRFISDVPGRTVFEDSPNERFMMTFYKVPSEEVTRRVIDREVPLTKNDRILRKPWYSCRVVSESGRVFQYYYPEKTFLSEDDLEKTISISVSIRMQVEQRLGVNTSTTEMFLLPREHILDPKHPEIGGKAKKHIAAMPISSGYFANAHEISHCVLSSELGDSRSPLLSEGIADLVAGDVVPVSSLNRRTLPVNQHNLCQRLVKNGVESIPLSFSSGNKVKGIFSKAGYTYERLFVAALIVKYGSKKFKEIYSKTVRGAASLYDEATGKRVPEEQILIEALEQSELSVPEVRKCVFDFAKHILDARKRGVRSNLPKRATPWDE